MTATINRKFGLAAVLAVVLSCSTATSQPGGFLTVPDIATMQALANPAANPHVHATSYTSGSGYGGGDFDWSLVSCTPNAGVCFAGVTGFWRREINTDANYLGTWFGAVPDNTGSNYTAALKSCISSSATAHRSCHIEGGTYTITPATSSTDYQGSVTIAFPIVSNLNVQGDCGLTVLKVVNNFSTTMSPKPYGIFQTALATDNMTWNCLTIDLNGANNLMGGHNYLDFAIETGGASGGGTNGVITNLVVKNGPGSNQIVLGYDDDAAVPLGNNWLLENLQFFNNGLTSIDNSTVFSDVNNMTAINVLGVSDLTCGTAAGIGPNFLFEVHGSNQHIDKPHAVGYCGNVRFDNNNTANTSGDYVTNAINETVELGTQIDHSWTNFTMGFVTIDGATSTFDDTLPSGVTGITKAAVNIVPGLAVSDVMVRNLHTTSTATVIPVVGVQIAAPPAAAQVNKKFTVEDTDCTGCTWSATVTANSTNGLKAIVLSNNANRNCAKDGVVSTICGTISIIGSISGISGLSLQGNNAQDDRGSPSTDYNTLLSGSVVDLAFTPGQSSGVTTAYDESAATVTGKRRGFFSNIVFTPVFKFGGSAITLGNGTVAGRWSLVNDMATVWGSLTVGSTTTIPTGSFTLASPFTAVNLAPLNLGTVQLFDTGSSHYTICAAALDFGAASIVSRCTGGGDTTGLSPITIQTTGNTLTFSVSFPIQ